MRRFSLAEPLRIFLVLLCAISFGCGNDNVIAPDVTGPTQINVVVEPTTTRVGNAIAPPVQVQLLDVTGHPVDALVTVTLGNPQGAVLSGTLTQGTVNGIATFSDVRVNQVGTDYFLVFYAGDLAKTQTATFNVIP